MTTPPQQPPPPLSHQNPPPPPPPPSTITPLEQSVLDEYTRLLSNLHKVSALLSSLADRPTADVLDGLRVLERKTSLVCTLLKASVYSIVLQQQVYSGEGEGGGEGVMVDG